MSRSLSALFSASILLSSGILLYIVLIQPTPTNTPPLTVASAQPALVAAGTATASTSTSTVPPTASSTPSISTTTSPRKASVQATKTSTAPEAGRVQRIQHPYPFEPVSAEQVNTDARAALVNILCMPRSGSVFSPISGSGVIVDPRGVILTNAHVAQYILLAEDTRINLACMIRTGAPARAAWSAEVLYIPPVWVEDHAGEINAPRQQGTGEHDYGLIRITSSLTQTPLPAAFPYLAPDTREGIGFEGDQILTASYPAEFLGGITTQSALYPASSIAQIGRLITFGTSTIDALSLGGIMEAQSGSSGGSIVNAWNRLIGLVVTTSAGATTAERDLHALTLAYIDRDLRAQRGAGLAALLAGEPADETTDFHAYTAPKLIKYYLDVLSK